MDSLRDKTRKDLVRALINIIGETNGISLSDTLDLMLSSDLKRTHPFSHSAIEEFVELLTDFQQDRVKMSRLLEHVVAESLFEFFKYFPVKYNEEHIHLTGSLTAEFIFPRLQELLAGANRDLYIKKIREIYGDEAFPINSPKDVDRLIRLKEGDAFDAYLKVLYLPKLILIDKDAHRDAAYHMADQLYHHFNVGKVRLKFSLSRASSSSSEQIPGADNVEPEDVVLGLYEGFSRFKSEKPDFEFILSPSFRKEASSFDSSKYRTRKEHFMDQINSIIKMLEKYPFLEKCMTDVDTVGSELDHYSKSHFYEMQTGFRKLQYRGFKVRSHHGEVFHTLKKGIQAVDNAMNIWHIDTLEHGISLGINPNYYFHRIFQKVLEINRRSEAIAPETNFYKELSGMDWGKNIDILNKIIMGDRLNDDEKILFLKAKFHTAREVEHYQHDVLNRMIDKGVSLIALPSSNNKLTGKFKDYKEHPFSWWEKKNVLLGVGTDNYVTLNTNYIQELLILLFTDPKNLKITKLLMVATGETRRPYISHLLWKMRKLSFI
jgi:adenosine deaminase